MSSFNINGPTSQPMVQSSQNLGKDGGGGGNTGYMNMRKRKKNSKGEEDNSVFLEEEIGEDTFEREGQNKKREKKGKFINKLAELIKDKKGGNKSESDSFTKQETKPEDKDKEEDNDDINQPQTQEEPSADSNEEYEEEEYEDLSAYNQIPVNKIQDTDDEYEVVDDDYYDDIDV